MNVSARTPHKNRSVTLARARARKRAQVADSIPTVEEAKQRLDEAAGRPQPWLTPEGLAVFADAPTEDLGPDS
jgi:hypothetical protein